MKVVPADWPPMGGFWHWSMHPLNLALRIVLEVAALTGLFLLGLIIARSWWAWVLGPLLVVMAMVVWWTFAVPGDPTRPGRVPVPVSGMTRLLLEAIILTAGILPLIRFLRMFGLIIWGLLILHYVTSQDRIKWLIRQ